MARARAGGHRAARRARGGRRGAPRLSRHQPFVPTKHVLFVVASAAGGRQQRARAARARAPRRRASAPRASAENPEARALPAPPGSASDGFPTAVACGCSSGSSGRTGAIARLGVGEPAAPPTAPSAGCAQVPARGRARRCWPRSRSASRSPRASRGRCGGWRAWPRRATPATSRRGWRDRRRHDEVRVLAEAFDRMLDRLEDAFDRQRGFVADASHELRTPLTVIRGQLEVLARQRRPDAADVRRVEKLVRTEVPRMEPPRRGPAPARAGGGGRVPAAPSRRAARRS